MRSHICFAIIILIAAAGVFAQPPHPPGAPHPDSVPRPPRAMGEHRPNMPAPQPGNWIRPHDVNENGILETDEFTAAIEKTFAAMDKNNSGILETDEVMPKPMRRVQPPRGDTQGPGAPPVNRMLPPFFTKRVREGAQSLSRTEFEQHARAVFAELDENGDGSLSLDEAAKHMPPHPAPPPPPPAPPNAHFIAPELRFGDKVVKGQPFSADILIEETRRLFDGSLVTRRTRGSVYRDTSGRTRREQPMEMVAGFPVVGANDQPQMLVFINDFGAGSHIFLDMNNKVARTSKIGKNAPPATFARTSPDASVEDLGTKTIEGVAAKGTRTSFEIPAGNLGGDKPQRVIEERWFSADLQVVVLSRHIDPIGGEHVFKLLNIKRAEPVAELFSVPAGFRFEN